MKCLPHQKRCSRLVGPKILFQKDENEINALVDLEVLRKT